MPPRRILWVTEEPPDRGLGGGSIRQAHLFEALAGTFATDLLLAGPLADERVRGAAGTVTIVPKRAAAWTEHPVGRRALELGITLLSPYPSAAYPAGPNRRALARALAAHACAYDLVCVEHAALAPLMRGHRERPATLTLHHLISEMTRQQLAHTSGARQRWFRRRDLAKATALERGVLDDYNLVFTCSAEDRAALMKLAPEAAARVRVIPNGVDLDAFDDTPPPRSPDVLFPGSLGYAPNVEGALWFCAEVWPRVRAHRPDARLLLAGREPVAEVRALEREPGVSVRANVPSMPACFSAARAVVVPLHVGTGTRLKALEAMAARRPLVGTAVGLEGIGIVDGRHALVRDDPEAMAQAVLDILADDDLALALARAGRELVAERFGWDRIGAQYVAEIGELLAARAALAAQG